MAEHDHKDHADTGANAPDDHRIEEVLREVSGEVPQDVIEIAGQDVEGSDSEAAELSELKRRKSESFYSDLVFTLAGIRYGEAEARLIWVNLLAHKWDMSQKMDRNVGIRVAALDYFSNVIGELACARIMDMSQYIATARLAVTDGLTGLFNHRYFMERLGQDIDSCQATEEALSLLMIDIDHFKIYNDINGHMAGDVALKEVASVIRSSAKREDFCARYGGEEFAVVAYRADKADAARMAERLREEVERLEFPNEEVLPGGNLTISCGVATFPSDAQDRSSLISYADRALYIAKNSGRNRVCAAVTERRQSPRETYDFLVHWRKRGSTEEPVPARMRNICSRGIGIEIHSPVERNQLLELHISPKRGVEPVKALARVVWSRSPREGVHECGAKFVGLNPETREAIDELIRKGAEAVPWDG